MQFSIYICAFRSFGVYRNGSHRSSNGFMYSYTEFDNVKIYSSIPLSILNQGLREPIHNYFSKFENKSTRYRAWDPEEYGITENEIDIKDLLEKLNKGHNPCYSDYLFLLGNRDNCPFDNPYFIMEETDYVDLT